MIPRTNPTPSAKGSFDIAPVLPAKILSVKPREVNQYLYQSLNLTEILAQNDYLSISTVIITVMVAEFNLTESQKRAIVSRGAYSYIERWNKSPTIRRHRAERPNEDLIPCLPVDATRVVNEIMESLPVIIHKTEERLTRRENHVGPAEPAYIKRAYLNAGMMEARSVIPQIARNRAYIRCPHDLDHTAVAPSRAVVVDLEDLTLCVGGEVFSLHEVEIQGSLVSWQSLAILANLPVDKLGALFGT